MIRTCLWLEKDGEEAVAFYTGLFPDSAVQNVYRPAPAAPPLLIDFTLGGAPYTMLISPGGPPPSAASSISAVMDNQAEADRLYDALLDAGGSEVQCGWITDRWGISWQVVPGGMYDALFSDDGDANQRAFAAMSEMKRLVLDDVIAARN
jgi:predicted 3-demethylubiquinone-9 3-methyltransferase (glyoxalase superfamily)